MFTINNEEKSLEQSWEYIKDNIPFDKIKQYAYDYSRLNFNSTSEIEDEFDENDMFNLINNILYN